MPAIGFDDAVVCAAAEARRLADAGWDPREAAIAAARATGRLLRGRGAGVGQTEVLAAARDVAEQPTVKAVREAVSPWLWVLSVISFGLAITNARRVAILFHGRRR